MSLGSVGAMSTPRARQRRLSAATVARLPLYQRVVADAAHRGESVVDSVSLGTRAGVTPATVRRDLAGLGTLGTRGTGYDVALLGERLAEALGHDRRCDVAIVGLGHLGHALATSRTFLAPGAHLSALYDVDPSIVGTEVGGLVVRDLADGVDVASVAVLAVPSAAAQGVADVVVRAGIRALLNFAPTVLHVPPGVAVQDVDLSTELQILLYHLHHGTGPLAGGLWRDLAAEPGSPLS